MMWNFALDSSGQPMLPGTNSCGGGCRGVVTIPGDGGFSVNEECEHIALSVRRGACFADVTCTDYVMAQTSRAVIPKDPGGPFAQRIGVSVGGSFNWALRVGAYQTGRANPADPNQYTLVVLNWFVIFFYPLPLLTNFLFSVARDGMS